MKVSGLLRYLLFPWLTAGQFLGAASPLVDRGFEGPEGEAIRSLCTLRSKLANDAYM